MPDFLLNRQRNMYCSQNRPAVTKRIYGALPFQVFDLLLAKRTLVGPERSSMNKWVGISQYFLRLFDLQKGAKPNNRGSHGGAIRRHLRALHLCRTTKKYLTVFLMMRNPKVTQWQGRY